LALNFERKRQFNKAQVVYEYMASYNKNHKDPKIGRVVAIKTLALSAHAAG
jgi:hypothetical protein